MSKIEIELKNQLEENISAHKDILEMSGDITDIIQNIYRKLKKGGKILFCGNDYSFDNIFLRPFQSLAKKNDILICISTSGNSKNILKVLVEAKKQKVFSIGFLGKKGGKAKKLCNKPLIISSENTARIQECHIFLGHFILEKVEDLIISKK